MEWIKGVIPEGVAARYRQMRGRIRGVAEENGVAGAETRVVETYGVVEGGSEVGVVSGYDHGVKEAEKMNESENASELFFGGRSRVRADNSIRYLDAARLGVRHPQDLHIHQGAFDRCGHAQSCQGSQRMGLGHWETEAQGGKGCIRSFSVL